MINEIKNQYFFHPDVCAYKCSKEWISERRLLTLIAGMLFIFLIGVQAIQNINEGICCGNSVDYSKRSFGSTIGLQNLN